MMKRTERLIKITTLLQGRRVAVTADYIAQECEVSVRTIYRDIQELMSSGVPISGEAGVGYILDAGYHLPPLSFDIEEIESLVLGMAMVCNWTDDRMGRSARSALDKIKNALPATSLEKLHGTALFAFQSAIHVPWTVDFSALRLAIREKYKIKIDYEDEQKKASVRTIRPLAMIFLGPIWLLCGWCELRNDFRNFRIDRIQKLQTLADRFRDEPGKCLNDYRNGDHCDELGK
ncbi:MAG: helix-turn-helix transcriptional regulator [Terasakiella sp.]|uniref:helix-turn-helix transcriptional regulator n=1 Tax=unclassified Terasakiella TaxID=2614952 RepID=UPI003AFF8F51